MFRQHDLIPSDAMGRPIHLWRYGSFGAPLLVFPSAAGMAHEWEAHGMIQALAPLINRGRIKLYCAESNVSEAWTRRDSDPRWRMERHRAYERFVTDELVPWIRADCRTESIPIAVTGTSLGATYSANFALKYPETFTYALCMSGQYDVTRLTDGYTNADIYFSNPVAYVSNLEGRALELIRAHTHLTLVCGQGKWEDGNIEDAHNLAQLLRRKEISHFKDLWGTDVHHEWEWWQRQAKMHLTHRFGSD